ncbi:MAG: hypothetical protein GX621_03025 [Pirellulaceae bacterium]|nr:hypothetical protein [Pirellulaceae bacterium]
MKCFLLPLTMLLAPFVLPGLLETARATVTSTGNIDPANPASWTTSTDGYVGRTADGALTVDGNSDLLSRYAYIGHDSGIVGQVTVDGAGSTWKNRYILHVGYDGAGTLTITNGGSVTNAWGVVGDRAGSMGTVTVDGGSSTWVSTYELYVGLGGNGTLAIANGGSVSVGSTTYLGRAAGSTGAVHFGPGGGTLTTRSLGASPARLSGTGTINTRGLVSDMDLVFDSSRGLNQTFTVPSESGQNITVNLDMSDPENAGDLGAGYEGSGSLIIRDGKMLRSIGGYIGYKSGSTGTVTVDGGMSTWTNDWELYVGLDGAGTLAVTNGGRVANAYGCIGEYAGSTGTATISGIDSTWNSKGDLFVGHLGNGTLVIDAGGLVSVEGKLTIDSNGGDDSYVNMATGGMLALFGNADDSLDDFLDLINGADAIRYWESSISDWAPIAGAVPGVDYTLVYVADAGSSLFGHTLLTVETVPPSIPGDANKDGHVDEIDAKNLAAHWGQVGGRARGDFNNDGLINALDAAIMAAMWGHDAPTEQENGSPAVPEPSVLAMLTALGFLARGQRRRSARG